MKLFNNECIYKQGIHVRFKKSFGGCSHCIFLRLPVSKCYNAYDCFADGNFFEI